MTQDNFGTIKKSNRGRKSDGTPNPIDVHVGNRIRLRREVLGITQEKLAARLGLTFQQVQKYERAMNRVGASRLWDIAQVLSVTVSFFFDEMSDETLAQSPRRVGGNAEIDDVLTESEDPMQSQEARMLIKAYNRITNRATAVALRDLILKMSVTQKRVENESEEENA